MLDWNQLNLHLEKASNSHNQLSALFSQFGKSVESQVSAPNFHIKGITVSLHLEKNYFTADFAGRSVMFVFSSSLDSSGTFSGNVQCYLHNEFPEPIHVKFGEFNFSESGQTDLKIPNVRTRIALNEDLHSLYLALDFIRNCLYQ